MSVLTLRPDSDDTPLQLFTAPASPTTHYSKVDEETISEADYNAYNYPTDNTTVKTDIYGFPDHSSESGVINSVTVKLKGKYMLAGTCTENATVNPAVKIGSTVYSGGAQNLTSSTAEYSKQWTTNPATSAAWSWTEIDALLAGVGCKCGWRKADNYRNCYIYQFWVEVDYTLAAVGHPTSKRWGGVPFMRLNKGIWCL